MGNGGLTYTLGIPTYQRQADLSSALGAAVAQSVENLEIVVSDNGNSDATRVLCASYQDARIKYIAQSANIGAANNFRALVGIAHGDVFSWLQDDDSITTGFSRRACEALSSEPNAHLYSCYTLYSPSLSFMAGGTDGLASLYGPPFPCDWQSGVYSVYSGILLLPLALLTSVCIPPTMAFRRSNMVDALSIYPDIGLRLLDERRWSVMAGIRGDIIVDPFIGGVYRSHPRQASRCELEANPNALRLELATLSRWLDSVNEQYDGCWQGPFSEYLTIVPDELAIRWLRHATKLLPRGNVADCVKALLASRVGNEVPENTETPQRTAPPGPPWKAYAKGLVPPMAWSGASAIYRSLRASVRA